MIIGNIYLNKSNMIKPVEYEILDRWFNWMVGSHDCALDLVFYLRTKPETCLKRLHSRGRHEEIDRITLDYLRSLHDLHEHWLNDQAAASSSSSSSLLKQYYKPANVIIIDAD